MFWVAGGPLFSNVLQNDQVYRSVSTDVTPFTVIVEDRKSGSEVASLMHTLAGPTTAPLMLTSKFTLRQG